MDICSIEEYQKKVIPLDEEFIEKSHSYQLKQVDNVIHLFNNFCFRGYQTSHSRYRTDIKQFFVIADLKDAYLLELEKKFSDCGYNTIYNKETKEFFIYI